MKLPEKSSHSLIARLGPDERVEGCYRFQSLARRCSADGFEVWHVRLADRSGVIDTYRPCAGGDIVYRPDIDTLVHVAFRTRRFKDRLVADLIEFDFMDVVADPACALDRLPRPLAQSPEVLDRLAELVHGIRHDALRQALDRVLVDDRLMLNLISRPDVLFERTVDAANLIEEEMYNFDWLEKETAILACLLHPMGELSLCDEYYVREEQALAKPRAALTLKRCEPALASLEQTRPTEGDWLRQVMGVGCAGVKDLVPLAIAVAMIRVQRQAAAKPRRHLQVVRSRDYMTRESGE
ncbi:MAG: hypothetical protein Q7J42_05015 [Sulfuritalea sp.]|nr:hypothetical protein [Sulfuritalea sp.]